MLAPARSLARLVIDRSVRDLDVIGDLARLRELDTPATPVALARKPDPAPALG